MRTFLPLSFFSFNYWKIPIQKLDILESVNCKQTVVLYFTQKIKFLCIFAHILEFPPVLGFAKVIIVFTWGSSMFTKDQGLFVEEHGENVSIYQYACIVCV